VRSSWPYMTPAHTCIMLIEPRLQWVVNCDSAPAGFDDSGDRFRGRKVYVHEGGNFESGGQKRSTPEWLAETPAAAHVFAPDGSGPQHGLPGPDPWLVLGSLEALQAYHPAFADATTEAWVSVAVHEFVHTHQLRAPGFERHLAAIENRESDPAALRDLYVNEPSYRARIEREYALLTRAAARTTGDPKADRAAAVRALREFWDLYRKRVQWLSQRAPERDAERLIASDALFSYIEGVARYVESDFLTNTAQHPARSLEKDRRFHAYAQFLGRGYGGSPNRQLDNQYVYAIGYHLCVLLDRIDPNWKTNVHTRSQWIYGSVRELAVEGGGG